MHPLKGRGWGWVVLAHNAGGSTGDLLAEYPVTSIAEFICDLLLHPLSPAHLSNTKLCSHCDTSKRWKELTVFQCPGLHECRVGTSAP